MTFNSAYKYQVGGSLGQNSPSYVPRDTDNEFYKALKEGEFSYVLNSRQMGKSSLRVQVMARLQKDGIACSVIDITSLGSYDVSPSEWYLGLVRRLTRSFKISVKPLEWWKQREGIPALQRLSEFIEEVLLEEISQKIVIFIDEIDSILNLNFKDDFFALIRFCYNQRIENQKYQRLTFALLGVATPSDLIQDKQRTPFNIGKAISLKGFQLHEAEPLIKGLQRKFSKPKAVMTEILDWTGGQPLLTQKLCQFMVEESEQEKPRTVEEVVKSRIIESWKSQDEPEHLRTIESRVLKNTEQARYLLKLYQQIRCSEDSSKLKADNTIEQSQLLLSGLVAKQEGKLRVYNRIYQEVFNQNWVEDKLNNLRPYSESFTYWVASDGKDESRLLRGQTLVDAKKWAQDKNLSRREKQFLTASTEKENQEKTAAEEQAAQLERERKDREAIEKRNQLLSEANKKAKRLIRNGTIILIVALLGAISLAGLAVIQEERARQANAKTLQAEKQLEEIKKEIKLSKKYNKIQQRVLQEFAKEMMANTREEKIVKEEKSQVENLAKYASPTILFIIIVRLCLKLKSKE